MTLSYCENGVARVRLPFRAEFEERHGVIHGGLIGLLADTAGNFAVGSVSPGSTVKTVEFKMSLLAGVQGDLLATGEVVRKGRSLATCLRPCVICCSRWSLSFRATSDLIATLYRARLIGLPRGHG